MLRKKVLTTLGILSLMIATSWATEAKKEETTRIKKDKISEEDIMFGNQQNKPASSGNLLETPEFSPPLENLNETKSEDAKKDETPILTENKEPKPYDYLSFLPPPTMDVPEEDRGYEMDGPIVVDPEMLYGIPTDLSDDPPYDVSNVLYRRKRNLGPGNPLKLRKRSLHSSLGQLLGRRISRSALRPKRQVDRDGYFLMPLNYNTPTLDEPTLNYPYNLEDMEELEMPINYERPLVNAEPIPLWYLRNSPLQRRSSFYPKDYRYVRLPSHRKRSPWSLPEEQQPGSEHWGRFEKSEPSEDMLRLYALANLLADTEQPEYRYRRSV